ncbi:MAG TPA: helix-turn-helix transcriptional regulator [Terriglobales bacterium]|jgi:transcriptional regulator with XRE-family HTH domain|nr:helix-turn-helix transcriptional regulator [Terriglobales bacterium]
MAQHTRAGDHLRIRREELGMSLRDVHRASNQVARELGNRSFVVPSSRLHSYETHKVTPSIYRLYTLARLYRRRLTEVLTWYGIPLR